MAKSKYEKMEEIFQELSREADIDAKISGMEIDLESLENDRNMKELQYKNAIGRNDSKEVIEEKKKLYEEALRKYEEARKKMGIDKYSLKNDIKMKEMQYKNAVDRNDSKEVIEEKKKLYEEALNKYKEAEKKEEDIKEGKVKSEDNKKLKLYKNFKENKEQIINIREYQKVLETRLEDLKGEMIPLAKMKDLEEEANRIIARKEEISNKLRAFKSKIENGKQLSDAEKQEKESIEVEYNLLNTKIDRNNGEYRDLALHINKKTRKYEEVAKDIMKVETQISKCEMIWICLLKGKSWDEINVNLAKGDYTAPRGTMNSIKDLVKGNIEKTQELNVSELRELANGERSVSRNSKPEHNYQEQENELEENKPGENKPEENKEETSLINPKKSFVEKHPWLRNIPGVNWIIKKVEERKEKSVKEPMQEEKVETPKVINNNKKDDEEALEYIDKEMNRGRGREEQMFYEIARHGFREAIKFDKKIKSDIAKIRLADMREGKNLKDQNDEGDTKKQEDEGQR